MHHLEHQAHEDRKHDRFGVLTKLGMIWLPKASLSASFTTTILPDVESSPSGSPSVRSSIARSTSPAQSYRLPSGPARQETDDPPPTSVSSNTTSRDQPQDTPPLTARALCHQRHIATRAATETTRFATSANSFDHQGDFLPTKFPTRHHQPRGTTGAHSGHNPCGNDRHRRPTPNQLCLLPAA